MIPLPQPPHSSQLQAARSDPCWQRRCQPLIHYLAIARDWSELTAWANVRGMSPCRLRNMLAWLEDEHIAGAFGPTARLPTAHHRPVITWRCFDPRG